MTDPNETLPLGQAYKEIDRLKAELAKAQAENVKLSAVIRCMHTTGGDEDCDVCRLMENNTALRQLLAPTIEVLRQATLRPVTWDGDVKKELARLRALTEGKV